MTDTTLLHGLAPSDLKSIIASAVREGVAAALASHRTMTTGQVAERYGVSPDTILRWERSGRIAPRVDGRWRHGDLERWDGDRATDNLRASG